MRHGEVGADDGQGQADAKHCGCGDKHVLSGDIVEDTAIVCRCPIDTSEDDGIGYECRDSTYPEASHEERPADEAPLGSHELHGVYHEAMGEDTQPHRIVDEAQRDDDEQQGNDEQEERGTVQVAVEALHQVLLVHDVGHVLHAAQLVANPLQAVVTGILWLDPYLHRYGEGVGSEEVRRVDAHALYLLLQGLFAADVIDAADVASALQLHLNLLCICLLHIVFEHDGDSQVLLDAVCHDTGREREQHNESHEYQQQADTYGTRKPLHNPGNLISLSLFQNLIL